MTDDLNTQNENILNDITSQIEVFFQSHQGSVKVIDVLSNLELSAITDPIVHKHPTYSKLSIVRLALFRRLKGIKKYNKLVNYVSDLTALDITYIPTKRTYNNFISRHITTTILNDIADRIISISANKGIILDVFSTTPKSFVCVKDGRHTLKSIELTKIGRQVLYPNIDLGVAKYAKYNKTTVLNSLSYVCSHRMFCNDGLNNMLDEHPALSVPNGDTAIYHCHKFDALDVDELTLMMNKGLRVTIDYGAKIYPLMHRRKVRLAIDKHDKRYYGDENHIYVCNGKKERGAMKRFTYITCSVVTKGIRFIIGALPLMDKEASLKSIDYLINEAVKKFRIDCVLMDRGFNNIDIVNYFQNRKMHFIMPQIKNDIIKSWMRKTEDLKAKIIRNFKIGTRDRYTLTNLILVDDKDGLKRAFITNINFGEQIAHYAFAIYRDRWGIETCYRQLEEDFNIKTKVESYNIRLFFFLFATCLFNLWVLINLGISI